MGLNYQMAFRSRGAPIVYPAVVHWNLGHYAALVDRVDSHYLVEDSTFGDNIHISSATLDAEASGYFLIPQGPLPPGWRAVGAAEGDSIWGRGNTGSNADFGDTGDEAIQAFDDELFAAGPCFNGCTKWNVEAMVVGLSLRDAPVGYMPPLGPAVKFWFQYSQRDALQPMVFAYTNLGPKWTFNWLSYVTDERTASGIVDLYERGGGDEKFSFTSGVNVSQPGMYSQSTITAVTNSSGATMGFTRQLPDGSVEQFNQAMGSQYFLTAVLDPQGNAVTLTYDSQLRVVAVTDSIGQVTTLTYGLSSDPLKLTKVTDPFGRSASFTYNSSGQLASITDVLGITSNFAYGANEFVNTLTTPYGATKFTYGDPSTNATLAAASERYVTATDTLGRTSRVEFNQVALGPDNLLCTFPPNLAPQSMATTCSSLPNLLTFRNTFVWDPYQLTYGATGGQPNYNNAKIMHWLHTAPDLGLGDSTSRVLESVVPPGEDRIWYAYEGQQAFTTAAGNVPAPSATGVSNQPTATGRVVLAGSEVTLASYNTSGHVTQYTDARGRQYSYTYASNGIDLLTTANTTGGTQQLLATYTYNTQHEPLTYTGANGKTATYQYSATGQLLKYTDPFSNSTSYTYNTQGYLTTVQGPVAGATYTFTYNVEGRVASAVDPAGYTVKYGYDAADRPTAITFPDGTSATFAYSLLDLASTTDRLGRTTNLAHDSERELTQVSDPLSHVAKMAYCPCGLVSSVTDPNGNVTTFTRDQDDRVSQKQFADGSTQSFTFDYGSSRVTEVLTQASGAAPFTNQYTYFVDGALATLTSTSLTNADVYSYTYDTAYPRLTNMHDSTGTTTLSYYPVAATPALGANQLQSVASPMATGGPDTVAYTYDALDRVAGQTVNGVAESTAYDALGRTISITNALDTFQYGYSDPTDRVTSATSVHGPTAALSYFGASGDELLKQISFTGAAGVALSQFSYTYNSSDIVTAFTETYVGQQLAAVMGADGGKLAKSLAHAALLRSTAAAGAGARYRGTHYALPVGVYLIVLMAIIGALGLAGFGGRGAWRLAWLAPPLFMAMIVVGCGGGGGGGGGTSSAGTTGGATNSGGGGGSGGTGSSGGGGTGSSGLTVSYAYDAANELLSATPSTGSAGSFMYAYDGNSNLSSIAAKGQTTALTYNSTNALSTSGSVYDTDGNPTTLAGATYTWDGQNRVRSVTSGASSSGGSVPVTESDFTYDGMSRLVRIVDKQNGIVKADHSYFWCGSERCLEHDNTQSGSPVSKQYFSQGVISGSQPYYYVTDLLGSVRQLVDASGSVQVQYEYDPYGNQTVVSGNASSDFAYAGYFHHAATGLDFALFRAYDSQHGRWLNRDPIGESGGLDMYAYADNDPATSADSSGLTPGYFIDWGWLQVPYQAPYSRTAKVGGVKVSPKGWSVPLNGLGSAGFSYAGRLKIKAANPLLAVTNQVDPVATTGLAVSTVAVPVAKAVTHGGEDQANAPTHGPFWAPVMVNFVRPIGAMVAKWGNDSQVATQRAANEARAAVAGYSDQFLTINGGCPVGKH